MKKMVLILYILYGAELISTLMTYGYRYMHKICRMHQLMFERACYRETLLKRPEDIREFAAGK